MTTLHFVLSTICIGFADSLIGWFIYGFLFHKYQALTPQTWKPESSKSYMYSTIVSFFFGLLFTFFYTEIGSRYEASHSIWGDCKLGLICFACFGFIFEMGNAIFINYDKMFIAGKLIALSLSCISAALIAGLFYW